MSAAAFSRRRWHHLRVPVRFPRARFVLGDSFSIGWLLLSIAGWGLLGLGAMREEREAADAQQQLERMNEALASTADRCIADELTCESVLTACVGIMRRGGDACACWAADQDGAR